jgi:catalase
MAKQKKTPSNNPFPTEVGPGGETHQMAADPSARLTTNQGLVVSDDQNSLKVGVRGPTALEDFILREKITHFDHERIPERVVHARGFGAHGYFQCYKAHKSLTKAAFLNDPAVKTPVFVRFSTVAGSEGSADTVRDVRGFATKFYTSEGVYDLVGNNIPVFFIQDAIKFPDLIHAVKPAPDRGFPQAQSAHDSFWDFAGLTPESMHMLMWAMSDRAIPRSFRMMEGFGVNTFRMINAKGDAKLVKFHWRPKLGTFSLVWPEAVCISGADPDFHRRDLWNAIQAGDFPEYELSVQAFTEDEAEEFDFDPLDPTKIVPEEVVPLTPLGKMVLNRNVDNFFAETEQVAFCPSHLVPGIDFSNDPLLQGRLFSYLDTQLSRLGGPNFHQLPINASKSPVANLQRDGHMQMAVPTGRVANEPSSLEPGHPRECHKTGFASFPAAEQGDKVRLRSETFADHYSQARQFYRSLTEPEQRHVAMAFAFELGKCEKTHVRTRMLGHLQVVDPRLGGEVADRLGMPGMADKVKPARPVQDVEPSKPLSQYAKAPKSIAGRKIGVLTTYNAPGKTLDAIRKALEAEGAQAAIIAPKAGPIKTDSGKELAPMDFLAGAPSAVFDAVIVAPAAALVDDLLAEAAAVAWIRDAFSHLKVIGFTPAAQPLVDAAGIEPDAGVVNLGDGDLKKFIAQAKLHRVWDREPKVRP